MESWGGGGGAGGRPSPPQPNRTERSSKVWNSRRPCGRGRRLPQPHRNVVEGFLFYKITDGP